MRQWGSSLGSGRHQRRREGRFDVRWRTGGRRESFRVHTQACLRIQQRGGLRERRGPMGPTGTVVRPVSTESGKGGSARRVASSE